MFHTETRKYGPVEVHLLYFENFVTEDHYHNLLEEEFERLTFMNHSRRQREYVATRVLRSMVFGNEQICYNDVGAPYIEGEGFISISHAPHVVGLAFCKDFQIGLDLEPLAEKAKKVCDKFLSKNEKTLLDTESADEMTKVWSGKEALYKLAGRKGIIFADSLLLNKVDEVSWKGIIEFPDLRKIVSLRILEINDFVLSVNDKPIQVIKK
jgi:phosphopantetheinyl transferase